MKNKGIMNLIRSIFPGLVLLMVPVLCMAEPPEKKGYQLLFEENFKGDTLNTTNWIYREGRREGLDWVDGLNRKENVYVKDGVLHIVLKREKLNGRMENTGGGIISRHDFGYGYYECLSKPFMSGRGVHTSFWQRGSQTPNNDIFEIDSYEIDSKTWVATNNLYVSLAPKGMKYSPWPHRAQVEFTLDKEGWFLDAYEYTPEGVTFYDNGNVVAKAEWNELNAAQMVWLTALNGVGKLDTLAQPGESVFRYFRYYAKDYPGINIFPNGNFEFNQDRIAADKPVSWTTKGMQGAVNVVESDAARDNYKLRIGKNEPFDAMIHQSLTYIMNGNYQLSAMVRTSGKLNKATIKAFGFGGIDVEKSIQSAAKWTKISIPVEVKNNRITIAISANGEANEWLEIDDVQLMKPASEKHNDSKLLPFWTKNEPVWQLAINEPITFTGDQKFYFFDRNVGFGDSITISMSVNATEMANTVPIARMPKKGESGWAVQLKEDGGLIFCIGSIENHYNMVVPNVYKAGKPVMISCIFSLGIASVYSNGKLLKTETGISQNTKDATAAGRLGTVNENFDAVGAVVMENEKKKSEPVKTRNFRGTLQHIKIYNKVVKL